MTDRIRLGITLEGFQMDEGRDLIEDVTTYLDTNRPVEFLYDYLPVKHNQHVTTRAGFEAACQAHPLDAHKVVSFDVIAPQDLFETSDDFCQVFGPNSPALPGFDPNYLFYMPQTSFAKDVYCFIAERETLSRGEQIERLIQLLDSFPVRILYRGGACKLFAKDDRRIEQLVNRQGDITVADIEMCYTYIVRIEDPSVIEDSPTDITLERALATWFIRFRTTHVDF